MIETEGTGRLELMLNFQRSAEQRIGATETHRMKARK